MVFGDAFVTHRTAAPHTGANCHTACARSHIGDATKVASQSTNATAQPPAFGIGRHPPLDPAEHHRPVRLAIEIPGGAAKASVLEMGEKLLVRRGAHPSFRPAGNDSAVERRFRICTRATCEVMADKPAA